MAKIIEVTVAAGRKFNHPYEDFSNLSPHLSIRAEIQEGEDPKEVIKSLQAEAESLIRDHKQHILFSLRQLHLMSQYERKVARLESSNTQAQQELEKLREQQEALLPAGEGTQEQLPF